MRAKLILALTKAVSVLEDNDFRFRTLLKYVVLYDVILRFKRRWYEHCI